MLKSSIFLLKLSSVKLAMEERMKSLDAAALAEQDRNTIVPLIKLTPQRELEYAKASLVKNLGINKNSTIASRLRYVREDSATT